MISLLRAAWLLCVMSNQLKILLSSVSNTTHISTKTTSVALRIFVIFHRIIYTICFPDKVMMATYHRSIHFPQVLQRRKKISKVGDK